MSSGSPPTLWWDLILAASRVPDSMTSGYSVPCTRNRATPPFPWAELLGRLLEHPDEGLADGLALLLRVGDAGQHGQETVGRLHVDEVDVELAEERLLHLLGLPGPQEAGVDEDAGELVADRLVDQGGGHRRVDPAGQAADHGPVADLGLDGVDRLLDDRHPGPGGPGAAHVVEEGLEDLHAPGGVDHLGVELHAVDAPLGVLERRHRRRRRGGDLEARRGPARSSRRGSSTLPVRRGRLANSSEESVTLQRRAAVLARPGAADLAAELLGDELAAVADAEHRRRRRRRSTGRSTARPRRAPTSGRRRR